jgi:hypothetical protein
MLFANLKSLLFLFSHQPRSHLKSAFQFLLLERPLCTPLSEYTPFKETDWSPARQILLRITVVKRIQSKEKKDYRARSFELTSSTSRPPHSLHVDSPLPVHRKFFMGARANSRFLPAMNEMIGARKADFNELLCGLLNEKLDSAEGPDECRLRVECVDVGVLIYPDDLLEDPTDELLEEIASPVYKEDLTANASLLVDMLIREVARGLFSKVLMQISIGENREAEIKNTEIYETELLARDLEASNRWAAYELMLEQRTNKIATVTKSAFEQIMREETVEDDFVALTTDRA